MSAATGSTNLRILNANGPGDQTVANGILVVNATNGGTTSPDAFTLVGEARGGAYDYFLFRGGLNGDAPNNWFLRSTFGAPGTPPVPPGTPPILEDPPPVLPPDPPPSTLPPGTYPIIGPELATYGVVQPVARQLGLATLGTLNQRIGDTMTLANAGTDASGWGRSDWGRLFRQQINDHYQAFADPRADGWIGGLQAGIDLWRGNSLSGHRDAAGVYFAYSQAAVNVDGFVTNAAATGYVLTHTGSLNLNAYSAGGVLDPLRSRRVVFRCDPARDGLSRQRSDAIRPVIDRWSWLHLPAGSWVYAANGPFVAATARCSSPMSALITGEAGAPKQPRLFPAPIWCS